MLKSYEVFFLKTLFVFNRNCSQLTKLQALQSRWHEPTENEMNSSSETTVQWQPVQVGGNLPTPEVSLSSYRCTVCMCPLLFLISSSDGTAALIEPKRLFCAFLCQIDLFFNEIVTNCSQVTNNFFL